MRKNHTNQVSKKWIYQFKTNKIVRFNSIPVNFVQNVQRRNKTSPSFNTQNN